MPELGTAWVTLAISTEKAERDIKRAFSSANTTAAGRRAGQQFSSGASEGLSGLPSGIQGKMAAAGAVGAKALGGALTLGVAAVGTAVAGTLGAALSKGFERLVSIDDAKFKLKALGNSAADVQDIMDSALESVQETSFGLGEAAGIAANAVAAGVKPGQDLTAYLKLTADAAAVANTSLGDMGRILNQARTSGNVFAEDLMQLSDRGLPIYQWLGEEAGVAAGQIKKLASEGKVSSEMLEAAIQKNIGGAAKTMGESFSGSVKNAQAALGRLGAALLAPAFAQAPGGISSITDALKGMEAWVKNNQDTIIGFWETVGVAAISTAQSVLQAVGEITVAFGQLVGGIGNVEGTMLKLQSAGARLAGRSGEADELLAQTEEAFSRGESITESGNKMLDMAAKMDQSKDSLRAWGDAARSNAEVLGRLSGDASKASAEIKDAFAAVPKDVPIRIDTPNGQTAFELLKSLGAKVSEIPGTKEIAIDAPASQQVIDALSAIGVLVREDNGKLIIVEQEGAEEAGEAIDRAARDREATIRVLTEAGQGAVGAAAGVSPITPRADGAIVPMADGGLRQIEKPDQADIYAGRGAGTIFAEEETGGEAYIPLAPEKRGRSLEILAEVQRLFGVGSMSEGGITDTPMPASGDLVGTLFATVTRPIVDALAQIRTALSSRSYSSSSPMPVQFAGSDAALLAQIPKGGSYDASGDLSKGLGDCTSAIEDLVNMMDGMPTAGREMSTGNAAEWLASRGFLPTDEMVPGAFNVGFNDRHMEATLPGGTNVNFGSDASVASGGVSGAVGAFGDSSFTQHFYRAADELDGAWSSLAKTSYELDGALSDRTTAETQLSDMASRQASQLEQQATANKDLGSSLGSSFMGGIMQSIGLDGSVFSDPTQWPNVKSAMALANWGGGLIQGLSGTADSAGPAGGGGGMGLGGLGGFLQPLGVGPTLTQAAPDAPHQGGGQPAGPAVVVNGNIGMDPRAFTQRVDAAQNQSVRRNLSAVRPA
jgi:tape measure domain-containing protein